MRLVVRIVALAVAAGALAFGAVALTSRDRLDDRLAAVEAAWTDQQGALDDRYAALATATDAVREQGGGARSVVGELDRALAEWRSARDAADLADELRAANSLEGLARRLEATIEGSPRLGSDASALALEAYRRETVATDDLNAAVSAYGEAGDGGVRGIVARALGHERLPLLLLATT